ncbi:MAG: DUF378 domain-containing protein [Candidatus Methanoperedens sp.]|nr:DUF378 domain-containing protein [Candidatus Methanoperedens nitroreducens]MDJ1422928.1 DUF378 domain-containing protein [Candidatus Methanoperedens sp.]
MVDIRGETRVERRGYVAVHENIVDQIAIALVIIGGLNWGLIGLFNFDLVAAIFGSVPALQRLIYVLVGLSALYLIFRRLR